jgi:DNA-binding MarR family transcriptional regulator
MCPNGRMLRPADGPSAASGRSQIRRTDRVLLHLGAIGRLAPAEVARTASTQRGISEALNYPQNAVSNVLHRLISKGLVGWALQGVQGQPRRLRVYWLTPSGETQYRALRGMRPTSLDAERVAGDRLDAIRAA